MTAIDNIVFIGAGTLMTLQLLFGGLALGMIIGITLSIFRYIGSSDKPSFKSNLMVIIIKRFISIIRGTPLILQLSLIYFCIPGLTGIRLNILQAGILAFGLNSSAYIAEILRSGIENLPKSQFEAAKTLQIPTWYMWRDIILPQVFKSVLPAMISETIALLKETALISTLGGMDLMRRAQSVAAEQFTYFIPICTAGAYYYLLILLIEYIGKKLEERSKHATT
jgi:polar amino acid transport system permease protein